MDPFLAWLLESAGLNPLHYRAESLHRRLNACLRAVRMPSVDAAWGALRENPALLEPALNAILLGVTGFFRDPAVFARLMGVLPVTTKKRPLRVWSAACAAGQELYSVAMLLAEAGLLEGSVLLGTDCRVGAIRAAKSAIYAPEMFDGVDPSLRDRYFLAAQGGFRVNDSVRAHVRWKTEDLFRQSEPGPWDLILWRNHAIYLTPVSVDMLWRRLLEVLRPGGILVTGRAERPHRDLPLVQLEHCVFQRTEGHVP